MSAEAAGSGLSRKLASPWWALAFAVIHALLAWSATLSKSNTSDEIAHLVGGVTIWRTGDFRMNPEAGNLQQRLVSWPVALSDAELPQRAGRVWWGSNAWLFGFQFLNDPRNDHDAMLSGARAATALVGGALLLAIWSVSRGLFGGAGAFVSAAAAAFSPTLLAHAGLATTDTCAALFFVLTTATFWTALERATLVRWLFAGLAFAGLALSKFSFPIVVPVLGLLFVLRVVESEPLELAIGAPRRIASRAGKFAILAALCVGALLVVGLAIWTLYGFRYSVFAHPAPGRDRLFEEWEPMLAQGGVLVGAIEFARSWKLLPEAFLYGLNYVVYHAQTRPSFLNGAFSQTGFVGFFPYAFVAKTELSLLALLAAAAFAWKRDVLASGSAWRRVRPFAPWLALLAVYWAFSLTSKINIGHRHILPTYPVLFIGLGALGAWLTSARKHMIVFALLLAGVIESAFAFPNYLAFFNVAAGGTSNGWKHLVDSSLDWGQDLPAVRAWLQRKRANGELRAPPYFAYFGSASPTRYRIDTVRLPGWSDLDLELQRSFAEPRGGTYLLSATLVQGICTAAPGPWLPLYEQAYREARSQATRYLAARADPDALATLLAEAPEAAWQNALVGWDNLRFARLMAYVRTKEPIENLCGSILVFELTDAEIANALDGPR
ncbi:MAG: glycosyltransferase family 39 protein [Planctomycetes bacterium]|nr:glycosyltransferase family 39 protein [Planctomycetota bacterium]